MRQSKLAASLAVVAVLAVAGWWFVGRKTAVASPATFLSASPTPVKETIRVEANHVATYTLTPPEGKVPGWLTGHWTCAGKSAGIDGATDDTLIGFKIIGPDNKVIDKAGHHPTSGNFKVRIDGPGAYIFAFDNSGIIRSSARVVALNGTYQPD
jgi:hypothetical protein